MKIVFTVLFSFLSLVYSYSETSVWKISNGENTLYLGGTIHILRESDYPLPEAFSKAFDESNIIIFESSSNFNKYFDDENLKSLIEECNQFAVLYNNNEKMKLFIELTTRFQILQQKNEKVYEVFSDLTKFDQLTKEEIEIFVEMFNLIQKIKAISDDEETKSLLIIAESLQPKIEANKEFFDLFMNPDFKSLEFVLNEDTFGLLGAICKKYDIVVSDVIYCKPYIAQSFLLYQILGRFCKADGVDNFFMKKAAENNKQIGYLESDEVFLTIVNSGNEYGHTYYSYIFNDMDDEEKMKISFEKIVNSWKNGIYNNELFMSYEYEKENFPSVYEAVIKNRNNAWMPIIENYLKTTSGVFVLVGNGHMFGPDGLLTQLSEKGYIIEQQ